MATLNGAYYLQKTKGGKGKLISAVPRCRARSCARLGRRYGRRGRVLHGCCRLGCKCHHRRHQFATLASPRHGVATQCPHHLLHRTHYPVAFANGRYCCWFGAHSVSQVPSSDHTRYVETDGARLGARRRCYRPGRLLRAIKAHYTRGSCVYGRWYGPLLRGQDPRSRVAYLNLGADQCHTCGQCAAAVMTSLSAG